MTQNSDPISGPQTRNLIAPVWHTLILLAVFAALTIFGWLAQRNIRVHASSPPPRFLPLQIQAIIFEWATVAWVWFGMRHKSIRIRELVAGQWPNAKFILVDILLGADLWVLWIGISRIENSLLGHNHAPDAIPYPVGSLESILAVGVAVSAGVCEEIVFRGYLQRQFRVLSGSAVIAVILQAAVFGMAHLYQGVRLASMVVLYGMLFGVLAVWRRSLRPGIIAHVWSDIAARLLHA